MLGHTSENEGAIGRLHDDGDEERGARSLEQEVGESLKNGI